MPAVPTACRNFEATTSPSEFVVIEVSTKSTGLGNTCAAHGLVVYHRVDLVRAEDFRLVLKLLKSRPTGWLHSVPPYELAAGQWTAKGDTWMIRLAKVYKTARSAGVHISIEHPVSSQIWSHRSMIRMSSLPGVCDISCDLKRWGSQLRRLMTWRHQLLGVRNSDRTNCCGTKVCSSTGPQPVAVSTQMPCAVFLQSKISDLRFGKGSLVSQLTSAKKGHMTRWNQRPRKRDGNQDAIGGIKSPHISIARLPGWTSAGSRIRQVLEPLVENQWQEVRTTLEGMGKENAVDLPESLVQAAQVGLEREFNVEHRKCEPRRIHDGLMAAITAAAGDPDGGWQAKHPLESSRRYQHGGFSRWLTRRMASIRCKKPPTLLLGRSSKGTIPLPKNTRIEWRWN